MTTIDDLLAELDQEAKTTRRVLARVPDDHLDWRPHERAFTLGELAMHVATIPGAIAELSLRPTTDARTPIPRPSASSAEQLVATLDESVARAHTVLRAMGDDALATPWRSTNGDREVTIPRAALLRSVMLNHWYHHRGQLSVYLRQLGALVPAIYGSSADEGPAARKAAEPRAPLSVKS